MMSSGSFGDVFACTPWRVAVPHSRAARPGPREKYGKRWPRRRATASIPLDWVDAYGADAVRFSMAGR